MIVFEIVCYIPNKIVPKTNFTHFQADKYCLTIIRKNKTKKV
jgi:hypothetical protein